MKNKYASTCTSYIHMFCFSCSPPKYTRRRNHKQNKCNKLQWKPRNWNKSCIKSTSLQEKNFFEMKTNSMANTCADNEEQSKPTTTKCQLKLAICLFLFTPKPVVIRLNVCPLIHTQLKNSFNFKVNWSHNIPFHPISTTSRPKNQPTNRLPSKKVSRKLLSHATASFVWTHSTKRLNGLFLNTCKALMAV